MKNSNKSLREQTECVILQIGDIVVDLITGYAGTLVYRKRHIDPVDDDVYFWEVKWFNATKQDSARPPLVNYMEEEGLKLSIVVGTYEWYSVDASK